MEPKSPAKSARPESPPPAAIDSSRLFGRARRIRILHDGKLYQLTITRQNKLILTR